MTDGRSKSKRNKDAFKKNWPKYRSVFVLGLITLLSIYLIYPAWSSYIGELWNNTTYRIYIYANQ